MEVTAGESPSARSVFATLTVVDLPHEPRFPLSYAFPENAEKSLQSTETEPFFAENGDPEGFILHDGNAQIAFPKPGDIVPDRRSAAAYPSQRFNVHVNEELRKLMRGDLQTGNGEKNHARDESEEIVPTEKPEPSENALPIAAPFPAVSIVPEKRIFATHEPITCRIAAAELKTRLLVSLSKDGIPVAQLPVETLSAPVAVEFPENDLQSGVLQISVFDPRVVPPREVASQIVFRAAERFLNIETTEPNVAESGEAKDDDQTPPPTRDSLLLKITDERGMPVQTDLRVSLWEGELPVTKTVFPPVLLENDVEIENAYAQRRADDKPFLTEFPGVLTSLSLLGGGILSLVIFAFFFFRMLSGAVPLIVSLVTATVCVLLGVSLYHDHRLPNFDAPNRLKFEKGTRDETPARMKNVAGKIVIGENVASAADSRNENTVRAKDANGGVRRRGTLLRQWSATTPRRGTVSINTKCDEYSGTQSSASEYPDPESFVTEPFAGKRENDAKNGSGERFLRVEAIGPDGRTGFFERKL